MHFVIVNSCSKSKVSHKASVAFVVSSASVITLIDLKRLTSKQFKFVSIYRYKQKNEVNKKTSMIVTRLNIVVAFLAISVHSEIQDICDLSECSCTPSPLRDDLTDVNCQCSSGQVRQVLLEQTYWENPIRIDFEKVAEGLRHHCKCNSKTFLIRSIFNDKIKFRNAILTF